jgi:hypothetical protein
MTVELTDAQLKAAILEFLVKKGRWGAHYFPLETLVNWMAKKVRRNGKHVRRCLKELVSDGFLLLHKKGEMVSLNPAKSMEIRGLITK